MNRVRLIHVCLISLLSPLILCTSFAPAHSQSLPGAGQQPRGKPFVDSRAPMPPSVTRMQVRGTRAGQPIVAQTVDLTKNTPTVQDRNPYTPKSPNPINELPIVFQSNRKDLAGKNPLDNPAQYHVYRMEQDGSGVVALTGPLAAADRNGNLIGVNSSQSDPAFNQTASMVVYVDTDANGAVSLKKLDINARTVTTLLPNNLFQPTAINNPEFGVSLTGAGVGYVFAAKTAAEPYFHIYALDEDSGTVRALTTGVADDLNPTISPDSTRPVIAFDSNRANASGTQIKSTRDIWVVGIDPAVQNARQVTSFSPGGTASENVQPAWSTNKLDQPSEPQHFVRGQQLLGFATTRMDTANDGLANAVNPNGTHEIYWLKVTIAPDPANASVFTVTTPESTTNPAYKLSTSDPQHQYDDTHPTWPQFITTYRVVYQTDRTFHNSGSGDSGPAGQPTDIFASTVIDINAPTLVRYDEVTGDILNVTPRITTPQSTVTIKVKVADLETGMPFQDPVFGDGVFVQIKNPNSKYQSADGLEHKVFQLFTGLNPDNSHTIIDTPIEYESEPIFIGKDPADARFNTYPRTNQNLAQAPGYLASSADQFAYSGQAHPPDARWLPLRLESRDATTGIATYSATWKTATFPSDYVIDLIVYDQSLNPFTANTADRGRNWRIYDNVYGFSTQSFQAAHNILFVSDNAAGQKFFRTRFGTSSLSNVSFTYYGTESWMTDFDVRLHPTQYTGNPPGPVINVLNTLGVKSYSDGLTNDGTVIDGQEVPATQQYDIWRVICRGPLPDAVLAQYLPHTEQQPPDSLGGETAPRTVTVAPRSVIWHAPYTGDVFVGPGTLTDLTVQQQLHAFLQVGGRLLVSGQDIAWALTLGGVAPSSFITSDMRAQYLRDFLPAPDPGPWRVLLGAGAPNPISNDPWPNALHSYPGPNTPWYPISAEANHVAPGTNTETHNYAAPNIAYADTVRPLAGAIWDLNYNNSATGETAVQHYADAATNSKVVYAPMGLEGLNADSYMSNTTLVMLNRRTELVHNAVCWMRTGSIVGKVVDLDANPMEGVLVRLTGPSGRVDYTAVTREDGTYSINGVVPAAYNVSAVKPGFTIQKPTGALTHGGYRGDTSFRMTRAEPAVISGKVTRTDGKTPVVGATVTATDIVTGAVFTATTDALGNYAIERVPAFTKYTLTASAPGFGASIPVNYTVPDAQKDPNDTTVVPSKTYTGYDFQLRAEPGSVTGYVFAKNPDGSKGGAIAGATVTASSGTQTVTAVTDSTGKYTFDAANTPANGLDPGVWSLVATAPGYSPNVAISVTVVTAQNTVAADILLSPVAPGSLSGLVTRTSDNAPLTGVTITLKDSAGATIATATTGAVQTGTNGYRYNYLIPNVPAGVTYTVTATLSGFTSNPVSQSAAVTTGVETKNVNFSMEPLHTFPGNLTLVSAPYDYTGTDVADLLSVPAADRTNGSFVFATWELGRYIFYPTPPANTFRLGKGYFMSYRTNLPLSIQGQAALTDRPFDIALNPGWNLIGDPFTLDIDWTKVKVLYGGQVIPHDQAVAQGLIGSALYSYVSGGYVLDFKLSPWKGYWVRAYQAVSLRVDPTTDVYGRAASTSPTKALLGPGSGWVLNLQATANGLSDAHNYIGVSTSAGDGYDGFKAEKPPVFGSRYVRLTVNHDNWGDRSGGYGVDVRSASGAAKSWEFTVATTEANATATVSWPNSAALGRGVELTLTDLASGATRDMRTTGSYTWQTGEQSGTRTFRIEATRAGRNRLVVTGVVARQSGGRSGGVSVSYNLSTAANVEVRVLGANGTTVRSLTGRASRAAGTNELTWDVKSDRGVAMPAGTYTIEIRAQTPDGKQSVRQAAPIVIVR